MGASILIYCYTYVWAEDEKRMKRGGRNRSRKEQKQEGNGHQGENLGKWEVQDIEHDGSISLTLQVAVVLNYPASYPLSSS
jgi:hypothetical protein